MPLTGKRGREYNRGWIKARREAFFAGKCCVQCGSTEKLELDHIEPGKKVTHRIWSWSDVRRVAELAKCQILCTVCHKRKTIGELSKPLVHGTLVGYKKKGCKCSECRAANRDYERSRRAGFDPIPPPSI